MFNVNVLIGAQWEKIVSPIRSRLPANGKAAVAYKTRPVIVTAEVQRMRSQIQDVSFLRRWAFAL